MRHEVKGYPAENHAVEELAELDEVSSSQLDTFMFSDDSPQGNDQIGLVLSAEESAWPGIHPPANELLQAGSVRSVGPLYRAIDIIGALTLIVFLLPVLLVVAASIFLLDPGPVIFRHERVGKGGRKFGCMKFRTMAVGADQKLEQYLRENAVARRQWLAERKLNPDPRVTPLGRWLRMTSLDELPQLLNVLRGEMRLVGPRPIVEDELYFYGRYAGHYLSVAPGLTGLWQVSGRSETTYRRRVAADVHYVNNMSVMFDLRIILATVPAVLTGKGAA